MRCKASARSANDFYDEHHEDYLPARDEEFKSQVIDIMESYLSSVEEDRTPSFADFSDMFMEEFEFPMVGDWLGDEYENVISDCADQQRDLERDIEWEDK